MSIPFIIIEKIYIFQELYICILGRNFFVERSIRLIEEHCIMILHRSSGFRSYHRLFRQYRFLWSEVIGPHSPGNIFNSNFHNIVTK